MPVHGQNTDEIYFSNTDSSAVTQSRAVEQWYGSYDIYKSDACNPNDSRGCSQSEICVQTSIHITRDIPIFTYAHLLKHKCFLSSCFVISPQQGSSI